MRQAVKSVSCLETGDVVLCSKSSIWATFSVSEIGSGCSLTPSFLLYIFAFSHELSWKVFVWKVSHGVLAQVFPSHFCGQAALPQVECEVGLAHNLRMLSMFHLPNLCLGPRQATCILAPET